MELDEIELAHSLGTRDEGEEGLLSIVLQPGSVTVSQDGWGLARAHLRKRPVFS